MLLHIKNLVCDLCITVVRQQLEHLDLQVPEISLGTALVYPDPSNNKLSEIATTLKVLGFELIHKDKIS